MIEVVSGGGRWRDVIAWSGSRGDFELGPLRCRGRAAWMHESADDGPISLVAIECRRGLVDRDRRPGGARPRRRELRRLAGRSMSAVAEQRAALAGDPAVPQRDALLDPAVVADRLAERLAREGRLAIERCERLRAKYQVGRSLRVLYRIEVAGESHTVAARTFAPRRCEEVHREALASAMPTGALRPVAHDRELATVFWTFPNDRKLATLPALFDVPEGLARAAPRRWTRAEITAYAPEKSATARCLGADGDTVAFAKVYAGDEGERTHAIHTALADAAPGSPRVARALAYSREYRTLFVEPIEGAPVAALADGELERGLAGLAAALAALHRRDAPPGLPRFRRLDPRRLVAAAELIGRARPDVADRARALAAALADSFDPRAPLVCVHGDAHPKNGILSGDRVVLIDLDQVGVGAAGADLGGLLATLTAARCAGELSAAAACRRREAVLAGYAELAPLPPADSLRWHEAAALLVERALRAVQRVREPELDGLGAILGAAEEGLL